VSSGVSALAETILAADARAQRRVMLCAVAIAATVTACAAYVGLFDLRRMAEGPSAVAVLAREMWPPDFSEARSWARPLLDTFAMSVAGTAVAIVLSIPLAAFAAHNVTPSRIAWHVARSLLNALRAVPELILGIVLVAAVGFGALPGVLALGLHSAGMVGKFFAEAIEHAERAPIEAARAAGASPAQVVTHGILPQVLPRLADTAVYRWEYNFRSSMVLGMVGAGGIGTELVGSLRVMQYRSVLAILLVILLLVTAVDALSSWLRRRFA
jgi:phosphonate transport system permease protein